MKLMMIINNDIKFETRLIQMVKQVNIFMQL